MRGAESLYAYCVKDRDKTKYSDCKYLHEVLSSRIFPFIWLYFHQKQVAIMDSGGLEVLTNLLDTEDQKCRIGALRILKEITICPEIQKQITLMGGVEPTIVILSEPYPEQQLIATDTIANLAQFRRARNIFRRHGGIPKLVDLLDVDTSVVSIISWDHTLSPNFFRGGIGPK